MNTIKTKAVEIAIRQFFCDVDGQELEVYEWLHEPDGDDIYTIWECVNHIRKEGLLELVDNLVFDIIKHI